MNNPIPPLRKFISLYNPRAYKIISFLNRYKFAVFNKVAFIIKLRQKRPREVIGLDIGGGSIKIAWVRYIEGEPFLIKTKMVEFPPKAVAESAIGVKVEGETKEGVGQEKKENGWLGEEATLEGLKNIFSGLEISPGTKIVTVVSGPRVGVRQMTVPHKTTPDLSKKLERLSKRDLREVIRWEAKGYLSFSVEESTIDFDAKRKIMVEEGGIRRLRVCVAAATNEMLTNHISFLRKAGITPALITTIPFALTNLIKRYGLIKKDEVVAIIDMGNNKTDITIFKGENIEFNRSIPMAGDEINLFLTVALTVEGKPLKLNLEQAESVKKKWGIPLSEDRNSRIEEGFSIAELLSLIRPAVERLSTEIKRSFEFYQRDLKGGKVEKIFLLGGTSGLKGLREFLNQELGIEVEVGTFLRSVRFLPEPEKEEEKANISLIFAIAFGAALADFKGIDLFPLGIRKEEGRQLKKKWATVAITSIILLVLLGYKFLQLQLGWSQKRVSALKAQLVTLGPQTERIDRIAGLKDQIAKKRVIIEQVLSTQPYWQEVLKEISNVVTSNIYLTYLTVDGRIFILKGALISKEEGKRAPLTDFVVDLENSIFKNVEIKDMKKDALNKNRILFEIKCELD